MKERNAIASSVAEIGFCTKINKLPSDIVRACLRERSIIPPRMKARSMGAAGKFIRAMKYPMIPKMTSRNKSNVLKLIPYTPMIQNMMTREINIGFGTFKSFEI